MAAIEKGVHGATRVYCATGAVTVKAGMSCELLAVRVAACTVVMVKEAN